MRKLTFEQVTQALCTLEGRTSEVKRADMREALSRLSLLMAIEPRVTEMLLTNGRTVAGKCSGLRKADLRLALNRLGARKR